MDRRVDLPLPLQPSKPTQVPLSAVRQISFNMGVRWNFFSMCFISNFIILTVIKRLALKLQRQTEVLVHA
jgi:hypothetical protein